MLRLVRNMIASPTDNQTSTHIWSGNPSRLIAATALGASTALLSIPADRAAIEITYNSGMKSTNGFIDCLAKLSVIYGPLEPWRGGSARFALAAIQKGMPLAFNDALLAAWLRPASSSDTADPRPFYAGFAHRLLAGAIAGTAGAVLATPLFEVNHSIHEALQREAAHMPTPSNRTSVRLGDHVALIVRQHGWRHLFKAQFRVGDVVVATLLHGLRLGTFTQLQETTNPYRDDTGLRGFAAAYAAAWVSHGVATLAASPASVIQFSKRLDDERPLTKRHYRGWLHCAMEVSKEGRLWRCMRIDMVRRVGAIAMAYATYDRLKAAKLL